CFPPERPSLLFFSGRRRHTRWPRDWSSDVCSSDLPWVAKLQGKPYREQSRKDWEQVKRRIMRWCLRVKLAQNWSKFGKLLCETRSEERRVGKEGRSRWSPDQEKEKGTKRSSDAHGT